MVIVTIVAVIATIVMVITIGISHVDDIVILPEWDPANNGVKKNVNLRKARINFFIRVPLFKKRALMKNTYCFNLNQ